MTPAGARRDPARATLLLTAALASLAAAAVAVGPDSALLPSPVPVATPTLLVGLAVGFCLAELCLLHVEIRRQAYSVTLAGVPLVLGVLLGEPAVVVVARVLGSAAAFAAQRAPASKASYNLAAYAAEAALDVLLLHALVDRAQELTVSVAVGCYVVVLAVDALMSWLVLRVISWHQGRLVERRLAAVYAPALLTGLLATTCAYGLVVLAGHGAVGAILVTVFAAAAATAYRGFQVLHRRHESLAHLHQFVGLDNGSGTAQELAARMLRQVRTLMRAGSAELLLLDEDLALVDAEDDTLTRRPDGWAGTDPLVRRTRELGIPALLPFGTRDPDQRAWLARYGARDAVLVPLPRSAGDGVLVVLDRLGNTGSFHGQDQALLQTLAGHMSAALSSSRLLDRLRFDATHDALTGLGNRSLLRDALRDRLAGAGPGDSAVLLLDLDRFKEVNDTLGHHVGDALLCAVATRIVEVLPPTATVVRLGGDEFAALLPLSGGGEAEAYRLAGVLAEALAVPVALPEGLLSARSSIGVALDAPGCTEADLLRHADTAMYAAKAAADGPVVYQAEMDRGRAERLALLADLHLALDRDELELRYQPKLDLRTDRVTGVEALVRWQHPRLGLLGPDAFVPLAESNGLIVRLTRIVLQEALEQCAAWRAQGTDLSVAVNLSARTVHEPGLPEMISAALLHAGVPASRLVLEITEGSVMEDPDRAVPILERIAAIGVTLSLDDFGTGYSSLSYLQRLPVREVKVDRSFVSGLLTDGGRSTVLVKSIVSLAAGLGHAVVAEGAEDAGTVDLLRRLGCDLVQGYHISRPVLPAQVLACVAAHPGRAPSLQVVGL